MNDKSSHLRELQCMPHVESVKEPATICPEVFPSRFIFQALLLQPWTLPKSPTIQWGLTDRKRYLFFSYHKQIRPHTAKVLLMKLWTLQYPPEWRQVESQQKDQAHEADFFGWAQTWVLQTCILLMIRKHILFFFFFIKSDMKNA